MKGYQTGYLGKAIKLPNYSKHKKWISKTIDTNEERVDYTHFTIVHHKGRRLPLFTAVNIAGANYKPTSRKEASGKFNDDRRIKAEDQLRDWFYKGSKKTFARGHIVRRLDPAWGAESKKAQKETFQYTNSCPQNQAFNAGLWLELEKKLLETGSVAGKQNISVFCGPVLNDNDPFFYKKINNEDIKIPLLYWKVVVYKKSDGKVYAAGFLQSQFNLIQDKVRSSKRGVKIRAIPDDYFENLKFKNGKVYQVRLQTIEKLTKLKFGWTGVGLPYRHKEPLVLEEVIPPPQFRGVRAAGVTKVKMKIVNQMVL